MEDTADHAPGVGQAGAWPGEPLHLPHLQWPPSVTGIFPWASGEKSKRQDHTTLSGASRTERGGTDKKCIVGGKMKGKERWASLVGPRTGTLL